MKTLQTDGLLRLGKFATMVVLCVAIGLLGTHQRAEGWSAGPLLWTSPLDLPYGGAHGMMAGGAISWLGLNNLLPPGYLSDRDRQLLREGASAPDSIWGPGYKYTDWWWGALQLEGMIDRDIVELGISGYSCTDEPCFTLKDDWENDFDHLMNHEFADLSVWNPIKYWADKAKQDLKNNNRSRAMVHAGYAMHFAQDFLNPPHLGPLLWGSYQEVDWSTELEAYWETTDHNYVTKAWSFDYFQLFGRCIKSGGAFPISIKSDLLSYRYRNALAWPTLPSSEWINDQGEEGILLDKRIADAVMWSEQMSQEVLQYVFDLEPPGGCISPTNIIDFNGNGKTDIFWRHASSGQTAVWLIDGSTYSMGSPGAVGDPNWQIKGMGDFDGDGKSDLLWQDSSTGWTAIWFMDGTTLFSQQPIAQVGSTWQIKKIGDFNGDGKADILWQNTTSGWIAIWFMDGATVTSTGAPAKVDDTSWQIKEVADFNGDRKSDILWLNITTGWTYIWFMDGAMISSGGAPAQVGDSSWQIKEVGDFNGDGKSDILWLNTTTGWTYIWFMNGAMISSGGAPAKVGDSSWQIKFVGDFNGDSKADVFWQHTTTGWTYIWFMNGGTISSDGVPGVVSDTNWQIMN